MQLQRRCFPSVTLNATLDGPRMLLIAMMRSKSQSSYVNDAQDSIFGLDLVSKLLKCTLAAMNSERIRLWSFSWFQMENAFQIRFGFLFISSQFQPRCLVSTYTRRPIHLSLHSWNGSACQSNRAGYYTLTVCFCDSPDTPRAGSYPVASCAVSLNITTVQTVVKISYSLVFL